MDTPWSHSALDVMKSFSTNQSSGLVDLKVEDIKKRYPENVLNETADSGKLKIVFAQLQNPRWLFFLGIVPVTVVEIIKIWRRS